VQYDGADKKNSVTLLPQIVSKLISNTDCPAAFRKSLHKWYANHLLGERLGWTHCQTFEQLQCLKLYPSSLPLF
jgi:hypothetical protein